ncbi:LysR family transcriptional regulator [Lysobacter psychrotolerans]|uniref:LysR family transcriptional regulator n=2 Tax=Montanilutibacter psychrotolerans TaxID=1327343 RepID=A0A3M8SV47_9GAMM|nr:LysR family transcriptional regulator [Lysobacter psychrotolerans]
MDRLKRMALFARVVELGAMSAAARELGMTPSAVSQQLRQLEAETGVALLHRSTRRLATTEAGQAYYEGCAAMLHAAQSAERRLGDLRDAPRGELRVAAPVTFATRHLAPALAPLLREYPELSLRLFAEDRQIDLLGERIDLAIRVGSLADSSFIARRLTEWRHLLVATRAYAAEHGLPQSPEELGTHPMLILSVLNQPQFVELHRVGAQTRRVRVDGRIAGNNAEALKQLMLQHLGIARLPEVDIASELAEGRVVQVLPEWQMSPIGVYAVTMRRDSQPPKVRMAIEALRDYLLAGGSAAHAAHRDD